LESFEGELLLQSICAIIKSDGKIHQKELENVEIILNQYDNELQDLNVNSKLLLSQFDIEINLNYKIATDHFNAIVNLLNENKSFTSDFLHLVLKIDRNLALVVNQMNKSELIMLSRLGSIFRNYLS
jgi:hypothetical protein